MLKYIKKYDKCINNDKRSNEQKVKDLKKIGIFVTVRDKNARYKKGYVLEKIFDIFEKKAF